MVLFSNPKACLVSFKTIFFPFTSTCFQLFQFAYIHMHVHLVTKGRKPNGVIVENKGFFYLLPETVAGGAIICKTSSPVSNRAD